MKRIIIYLCLIFIISCANKRLDTENTVDKTEIWDQSSEMSENYKKRIENGEIKKLSNLEINDLEKYTLIKDFLSNDDKIDDYYYSIDEIDINFESLEYVTQYDIYYYKIFNKEFEGYRGDPTGKCFTIVFNNKNEINIRYYWK